MTTDKSPGSPLELKLSEDLKTSLRSGDKLKTSVLRMLLSSVNYAKIAKRSELADGDILGVIQKEIKQRDESIEAYTKGNRGDLVAEEEAEKVILKGYLPEQLSRAEIETEVRKVIAEAGASGIHDKGKVMPKLMASLRGKADGKIINEVVTELLTR